MISATVEWPKKRMRNISDYLKEKRAKRLEAFQDTFVTDDQRVWRNFMKDDGNVIVFRNRNNEKSSRFIKYFC